MVVGLAAHEGMTRQEMQDASRPGRKVALVYPLRTIAAFASEIARVLRGGTPVHGRLRDRLAALAITTIGVDLLCGVLALLFERGESHTQIQNFGDALFWTTTQLLTVSSNLRNPISTPARILDVFMEVYAITII